LRSNDSLEIAGLPESRGYRPRARRALAARGCVDELGVRPFRRHRRVRRGCCAPTRAVPIERAPTVEEVIDELRARLTLVASRAQEDGEDARVCGPSATGLGLPTVLSSRLSQRTMSGCLAQRAL
jgi:hypothetical protein